MRSQTSLQIWTHRTQLAVVAAALLLSLLPQSVSAGAIKTAEQAPGTACASRHTVAAGEMLSRIAENAGVSLAVLSQANDITEANTIYVGQQLCIPHAEDLSAQEAPSTPTTSQPTGTAANWTGKYYGGQELSGNILLTRQDAAIHFDWESGSPDTTVSSDSFSVSWTAAVEFEAGSYRFSARSDDGVRIYVDDTVLLEDWNAHPASTTVSDTTLTAGSHTIRVEYFEADGVASISVWWEQIEQEDPDCEIQPHDDLKSSWSHSALGCPTAEAQTVWSAWQRLQKGQMIWHLGKDELFVYTSDGNWKSYTDSWDDQELSGVRGTPSEGLQSPVRGFGHLWETNDEVFAGVGWATDAEKGFCALIQEYENGALLRADTGDSCHDGAHNFASETPYNRATLQSLDAGAWERVCVGQPDSALAPFWHQSTLGCVVDAATIWWTTLQPFQRGHMMWQHNEDAVYVFVNDGAWTRFSDDWNEQTLSGTRGTAPEGLQSPERGYGYLWENNDDVFADLGWASDVEEGLCAAVQLFKRGYLLARHPESDCSFVEEGLESKETLLADNSLMALNDSTWDLRCRFQSHEKLDHLWNQDEYGCPLADGVVVWSSWQPFQHGHMIWQQNDDAVFVFANDEGWTRFDDDWDDQEYTGARGDPPEGLQAPLLGFGYLWENDDEVFGDVGWATAAERGFCAVIQQYENGFLLVSDPVDSCLADHHNEATELDFALHSLEALNGGTWTLK